MIIFYVYKICIKKALVMDESFLMFSHCLAIQLGNPPIIKLCRDQALREREETGVFSDSAWTGVFVSAETGSGAGK